jgi:hypothetical protein
MYYVPVLTGYLGPMAVFIRDGVLYVAYDNGVNGSNIVRLDTGEVVKTCTFSDYFRFDAIVGGNGTAYGVLSYLVGGDDDEFAIEFGVRYVDLWSCDVIGEVRNVFTYLTRCNCYLFMYDMYHNRLVHVYLGSTSTSDYMNATVIDIDTGSMRNILGVLAYDATTDTEKSKSYYYIDSVLVTPDYYYIFVANATRGEPVLMYVFDARNLSLVNVAKAPTYIYKSCAWHGFAPLGYNRFGILYLKHIGDMQYGYTMFEIYRIVLCSNGFSNCSEYVTDLENSPGAYIGVVPYRDVFVVHGGGSPHEVERAPHVITYLNVPYAHIFLPDKGLLINTSIAGFAVPVDYNLWKSNKIVVFNPYGYLYVIDPPVTIVTETATVTNTVTSTSTATETTTITITATTTAAPYLSSSWLLLLMLILIVLAIIGIIKMASKSIIAQEMFVKKK